MSKRARTVTIPETYDFAGIVTKANTLCSDGATIATGAFQHEHLAKVPLVFQHKRTDPANLVGNVILEYRDNGDVYGYATTNSTPNGQNVKAQVEHGDIDAFSIYAVNIEHSDGLVTYGDIKEVSLVLSGANPGARIDTVTIQHSDGFVTEMDDQAIITFGERVIEHGEEEDDIPEEESFEDIINTMNEKQQFVVLSLAQEISDLEKEKDNLEINHANGGNDNMKQRIFGTNDPKVLEHSEEIKSLIETTIQHSDSIKSSSLMTDIKMALEHSDNGTKYGIKDIGYLVPEAKDVFNDPMLINYPHKEWVQDVNSKVQRVPFAKIKTSYWDASAEEARAKGYITGTKKEDEVFKLLKREASPTTIYKKNKLDRDDVADITGFDVIAFLNKEMDMKLSEEEARAYLLGDGRKNTDPFKIDETKIIPVYNDKDLYTIRHKIETSSIDYKLLPDEMLLSTEQYEGSGTPTLYTTRKTKISMLTQRDTQGNRIYRTEQELCAAMGVDKIVDVPYINGMSRVDDTTPESPVTWDLLGIIVNMNDYKTGANPLGEKHSYEDFDINYNQMIYLKEMRRSGMLVYPKSAVVIEHKHQ